MNQLRIDQACKLMSKINDNPDYESYFSSEGGEVKFIIESKIVRFGNAS